MPGRAGQTSKNQLPHEFQVVGYSLISVRELWERRDDWETAKETYCSNWVVSQGWERGLRTLPNTDRNSFGSGRKPRRSPCHTTQLEHYAHYGNFDGTNGSPDAANAPWQWDDNDDSPVLPLDFFYDPAHLVDRYFNGLGTFSHVYTGNSYDGDTHTLESAQPFSSQENYARTWTLQVPGAQRVTVHLDRLNLPDSGVTLVVRGPSFSRTFSGPRANAIAELPLEVSGDTVTISVGANGENKRFGYRLHLSRALLPRLPVEHMK